ncbi:Lon protease (ATP-dependent protease La), partial [Durusdinium trenchii]
NLKGPILCLHGPPGIGKTSLGRSIARAIGRKFHRIALGGVRDEAELRGHRRAYIGSIPGVIIQAFQTLGVNNPVILLDEVDKTSQNSMFNPQATLLEILDPEQNTTFKDHYLNTPFDLSNAIFICTANDTSTIDRPLLDRMEVIDLSGYTVEEKVAISRSHLLPKQRQLHALEKEGDAAPILDVSEEALEALVTRWTAESGVRSLERHLAQICRWAALRLQGVDVPTGLGREAAREAALASSGPDEDGHIKVNAEHLPHILGVELFEPAKDSATGLKPVARLAMGYRIGGPWGFMTTYSKNFGKAKPRAQLIVNSPSIRLDPTRSLTLRGGPCAAPTPANTMNTIGTMATTASTLTGTMTKSISGTLQIAGKSLAEEKRPGHGGRRESLVLKTFKSRDMRRKCLELLSEPDLKKIAGEMFRKSDVDGSGQLDFDEVHKCLEQLHEDMDLPKPDRNTVESLLKRFDTTGKKVLGGHDFFELLVSQLRRSAFDRGSVLGREFFLTKGKQDVWDVYRREKQLGTGSFGTAYQAVHIQNGEERVIKAVKKSRTALPLDEIEQEILIMRQIDHPHMVRLFEWYEDANRVYLVLDYLKGGSLKDVIVQLNKKDERGLKEAWIREVIQQTAGGLAYCHNLRLIHKDLKDENIMLLEKPDQWEKPHAVIIDLGVAEMFSVADPAGRFIGGTPTTMAPEVWNGNFGPKCDVWSLGCIMFELCTGALPFMASSIQPSAWTRLHKRGPRWEDMKTCADSKTLCKAMLQYQESDRPTMAEALEFPYFQTATHELKFVAPEKFANFLNAHKLHRARQGLLLEIASRMPFQRAGEIIRMFSEVDKDRTGTITLDELIAYFDAAGIPHDDLAKTFQVLDVDKDGTLSFSEFSTGALLLFQDALEDELHMLFASYDSNNDGILTTSEAETFLDSVRAATDLGGRMELAPEAVDEKDPFHGEDIHVHFPAGGIPKDGPSAGVAVLLALASLVLNRPVRSDTAVTGEVTLRGHVLPVGGIRDKVLAAIRAGVKHVLLPMANERHVVEDIPAKSLEGVEIHYLKTVDEALDWVFGSSLHANEGGVSASQTTEGSVAPFSMRSRL